MLSIATIIQHPIMFNYAIHPRDISKSQMMLLAVMAITTSKEHVNYQMFPLPFPYVLGYFLRTYPEHDSLRELGKPRHVLKIQCGITNFSFCY